MTPDVVLCVPLVGVHQHARYEFVSIEGLSVRQMGGGLSSVTRCVEPSSFAQLLFRAFLELVRICGEVSWKSIDNKPLWG